MTEMSSQYDNYDGAHPGKRRLVIAMVAGCETSELIETARK